MVTYSLLYYLCYSAIARHSPGQMKENRDTGTVVLFPGQSRENRDGWQLCTSGLIHLSTSFNRPSLGHVRLIRIDDELFLVLFSFGAFFLSRKKLQRGLNSLLRDKAQIFTRTRAEQVSKIAVYSCGRCTQYIAAHG